SPNSGLLVAVPLLHFQTIRLRSGGDFCDSISDAPPLTAGGRHVSGAGGQSGVGPPPFWKMRVWSEVSSVSARARSPSPSTSSMIAHDGFASDSESMSVSSVKFPLPSLTKTCHCCPL